MRITRHVYMYTLEAIRSGGGETTTCWFSIFFSTAELIEEFFEF